MQILDDRRNTAQEQKARIDETYHESDIVSHSCFVSMSDPNVPHELTFNAARFSRVVAKYADMVVCAPPEQRDR